jgi:hypothetical protein
MGETNILNMHTVNWPLMATAQGSMMGSAGSCSWENYHSMGEYTNITKIVSEYVYKSDRFSSKFLLAD